MSSAARQGYAKLLDAWSAPQEAGEPVGCLAISFTFQPAFFEEECLSRFLNLESDPDEDGPVYLIEREEKLAGATCSALVDARHCRGPRSLRWDLLPARVPGGVMHAKVALLCWQQMVRVIVASANLTEDGYRRNQEVFGVLDFHEESPHSDGCLNEVIGFLGEVAGYATSDADDPAFQRWQAVLERAWEIGRVTGSGDDEQVIRPVFVGPQRETAFEQLQSIWPQRTPPHSAHVVSPFFDPGARNAPAQQLWRTLRRRGEAEVTYHVTAEQASGEANMVVHAPLSLQQATPSGRDGVTSYFARLSETDLPDETPVAVRPLHAKTLWLEDSELACAMIGSSNFTSAGLGLSASPNVEANLVYCASRENEPDVFKALQAAQLRGQALDPEKIQLWQPNEDETAVDETEWPSLPASFQHAVLYANHSGTHELVLTLAGFPPSGWQIFTEDDSEPLYDESRWRDDGEPNEIHLTWEQDLPPTGLEVNWSDATARTWWPVNVANMEVLPPPAELKDLSLAALIHILTSAQPLKEALRNWIRRKQSASQAGGHDPDELDPHKRVDTSRFLLQRTRRVSWALAGLRERLERPVPTRQALRWRLYGPVGVQRIAEALHNEKRSDEEYGFLMAELLLELARVCPAEAPGCLTSTEVRAELQQLIETMQPTLTDITSDTPPATRAYIEQVITEVTRTVASS